MSRNIEEKMVFGLAPTASGKPVLMLGVPQGAWEYMKDGKTHTFDLTSLGVPIMLMLYGAKDHAEAVKLIEDHCKQQNVPLLDERRKDWSIKP
jgi:hypothetical protein